MVGPVGNAWRYPSGQAAVDPAGGAVGFARDQHGPGDARGLGGLRQHRDPRLRWGQALDRPARQDAALPSGGAVGVGAGIANDGAGAEGQQLAQPQVALAADAGLAALAGAGVLARGSDHTRRRSRALWNCLPAPMAVTMACAVSPPTPGVVVSRRITGSALAVAMIWASRATIEACNPSIWPSRARSAGRSSAGRMVRRGGGRRVQPSAALFPRCVCRFRRPYRARIAAPRLVPLRVPGDDVARPSRPHPHPGPCRPQPRHRRRMTRLGPNRRFLHRLPVYCCSAAAYETLSYG
jgi:hypothetical protein